MDTVRKTSLAKHHCVIENALIENVFLTFCASRFLTNYTIYRTMHGGQKNSKLYI